MQNAILYQAYGGIDFINECKYSLLKYLLVYNLQPPADIAIYIYTDQPHLFADFLPFFSKLECIPLKEETIKQWKGQFNFVHRFKIEMIRDFLARFNGKVLYCDTDTYITAPVEGLFQNIRNGNFYMHAYEGVIDRTQFPSFRKWEKFLLTTPIQYNGKKLVSSKSLCMYNAGVVGLDASNKELLNDVLALTDSVYEKFPKHIAEQFAFSYCLQTAGVVKTADEVISHYWNLKEFRHLLSFFFTSTAEESISALVKKVRHLDALSIMKEKQTFERLSAWQRFFKKISGKGWQIKAYEKSV